jgi:AraC-like DNA-binding protein
LEKLPLLEQTSYLPREQVELIRHLRDHIISDSENYLSLQSLAEEHEISVSSLQKAFKLVYGMPVYQYLREYRLERAASALQNTQQTVTEIALDAGFHNPAKFAESFKRRYGFTPTAFRKMKNKME